MVVVRVVVHQGLRFLEVNPFIIFIGPQREYIQHSTDAFSKNIGYNRIVEIISKGHLFFHHCLPDQQVGKYIRRKKKAINISNA